MAGFEFEFALVLGISILTSFFVFVITWPREGKLKLPVSIQFASNVDGEDEELDGGAPDPFDVINLADFTDGFPIDEDGFWKKMRVRKLILSIVLTLILIGESISLGWSIISDSESSEREIVTRSLHVAFALYIFVLSVWCIRLSVVYYHWRVIVHLATLTTTALLLYGTSFLLPTGEYQSTVDKVLQYTVLGLYFAAAWISSRTKRGPKLHFPPEKLYPEKLMAVKTSADENNVCGIADASCWDVIMFSYTTKVVMLGYTAISLEISDLPILPVNMRATTSFARMRDATKNIKLRGRWRPKHGSGLELAYRLLRLNREALFIQITLAAVAAGLFYTPAFFLQRLVYYLEIDPLRTNTGWGWVYCAGLFVVNAITHLLTGQLWSISTTTLQVRLKTQLNSILFAKTLVRKDVASSAASTKPSEEGASPKAANGTDKDAKDGEKKDDEDDFSSKAQIMTLMTTDVDRVSEFSWHLFTLVDSPIEIFIGTFFLYQLLGVSAFIGLIVTCLFLPMNHFASKVVIVAQENLMKARDERVALMNEVLGAIRMLKFMAWERSFEKRILTIRDKELKYQRLNYILETLFNAIWNATPTFVTLVSFWHFAVFRGQTLSPSIAFTSIAIFSELKYALNALPETFINMLQSMVSLRRIEKYLNGVEVASVPPLDGSEHPIRFQSATVTWPQDRSSSSSALSSAAATPKRKFILMDLTLDFPLGELSLICGKLGSGKTLLLLSLLGEADVLAGQISCPRTPPDIIASFTGVVVPNDEWVVSGVCAYVPQSAWLRNASIRDNILFNLPYVQERYEKTLEVCALVSDLKILEDGDQSEIGERGVNLSGGQKARVSLARAVYSRASVLLLDDVLSAVDAHTAHHLYHECLRGDIMKGRTVVLVSHHVQLCAPETCYIVSLDNGRVSFAGKYDEFKSSGVLATLIQSENPSAVEADEKAVEDLPLVEDVELKESSSSSINETEPNSESSSTVAASATNESKTEKKAPRKLIEEEKRAVGRIGTEIWKTYIIACGNWVYWTIFITVLILAMLSPVLENNWLRIWSRDSLEGTDYRGPIFYITIYLLVAVLSLIVGTVRWLILYYGSIHASTVLYKRLLEAILFAHIRFHDTISRGRLLNRFGKDFEGIDSSMSDNFGRSIMYLFSVITTFVTISIVGGFPFFAAACMLGVLYYNVAKVYGQCSRDMRRLDSVSRSPLYSIYGETIAGVTILRAFGASSKIMRDMLACVDSNSNPYYWMWGVNRWISARFGLLSSAVVGVTGVIALATPGINASMAGFALAFAATVTVDLLFLVRRFVGLEQSMVALERVKEFSDLPREPPEYIEPRPPADWPSTGAIVCENLVIRYAPDLPNVLHNLNFAVKPGEKIGILGRTGSGKSTLALSFFRFVEATEGRIMVDDIDIATIGLADLRGKLTIIPQDPTILSGTLRSTLDVFDEYGDAEIYEALRRVHLIPTDIGVEDEDETNVNVFRNLDSPVSEGGENFSTGEKQLICMARAILKRSKVLVMDEATASVDYATDELIGRTIRQEFANSTILTIAHRLRTVIDYDKIMLLEEGRIVEFDKPATLLSDSSSKFHSLCKATGKDEFAVLRRMAGS